jgi:hypothetical protein
MCSRRTHLAYPRLKQLEHAARGLSEVAGKLRPRLEGGRQDLRAGPKVVFEGRVDERDGGRRTGGGEYSGLLCPLVSYMEAAIHTGMRAAAKRRSRLEACSGAMNSRPPDHCLHIKRRS